MNSQTCYPAEQTKAEPIEQNSMHSDDGCRLIDFLMSWLSCVHNLECQQKLKTTKVSKS